MSLTPEQHLAARKMVAAGRSYANIGIALDKTADEIRDALGVPPCRYGRHAVQNQGVGDAKL